MVMVMDMVIVMVMVIVIVMIMVMEKEDEEMRDGWIMKALWQCSYWVALGLPRVAPATPKSILPNHRQQYLIYSWTHLLKESLTQAGT